MMRALLPLAALGLLATLAGRVAGQQVGEPAPELRVPASEGRSDETVSLFDRYPSRIIVLYYFSSMDSRSTELLPMLSTLDEKYRPRGVAIVGITRENRENVEDELEDHGVTFGVFGGNFGQRWRFPAPPLAYIIDTYRRIAYARFDPREGLEEKILAVLQKTPPPAATPERLTANFTKLSNLISKGDYARAFTLGKVLQDFFQDEEEGEHREQVEAMLRQISIGAVQQLEAARTELKAEDYQPACRKLAELSVRLQVVDTEDDRDRRRTGRSRRPDRRRTDRRRTDRTDRGTEQPPEDVREFRDIKEDVEQEIGRLQADNYTKAIILKALDNAKGEVRNDQATELLEFEQYAEARELYRSVAEDYAGTEAARLAQEAIDRINDDPEMRAAIQKVQAAEQAERWYDLGERCARTELFDLAREYFEKVLKEYPASAAAEKAVARLKQLPEEQKKAEAERERRESARGRREEEKQGDER